MTPIKFAEYVENYFSSKAEIKITVVKDIDVIEKEYPLLHAVARCSLSGNMFILVLAKPSVHSFLVLLLTSVRFISSSAFSSCGQARVQVR